MKKIFVTCFLLTLTISSFAQLKPEEGDIGLGFRITGLANIGIFNQEQSILNDAQLVDPLSIFTTTNLSELLPQQLISGKYYVSPVTAIRVGLGAGYINDKVSITTGGEHTEDQFKVWSAGLNFGYERHYASASTKLDPYGGVQLNSAYISKVKQERFAQTTSENTLTTITYPAGYGIGAHFFIGFNYFFTSNFAIGAEVSFGIDRISMGGDWTNDVLNSTTGAIISTETGNYKRVSYNANIGSTSGVNLTVFF